MALVLRGPAIGPDGTRAEGGALPPDAWPEWFLDELKQAGHLVRGPAPTKQQRTGPRRPVRATGRTTRGRST